MPIVIMHIGFFLSTVDDVADVDAGLLDVFEDDIITNGGYLMPFFPYVKRWLKKKELQWRASA